MTKQELEILKTLNRLYWQSLKIINEGVSIRDQLEGLCEKLEKKADKK